MMGMVAYLGRITVLSLAQNQYTLPTGHLFCSQALIIVPPKGYAAYNSLLYNVQYTDITPAGTGPSLQPHLVPKSIAINAAGSSYLSRHIMQRQPRQCQTKGALSPVPGSIYSKLILQVHYTPHCSEVLS